MEFGCLRDVSAVMAQLGLQSRKRAGGGRVPGMREQHWGDWSGRNACTGVDAHRDAGASWRHHVYRRLWGDPGGAIPCSFASHGLSLKGTGAVGE